VRRGRARGRAPARPRARALTATLLPSPDPDKGGDPKKFQLLQQAYEILSDEDKRARYDAGGLAAVDGSGGGGGGGGGMDPADLFGMLFGGGARAGGGGARGGARAPPPKGEDAVHPLRVTLEDCFRGKSVRMSVNRQVVTANPAGQLMDRAGNRFDRRVEREDLTVTLDRGAREGQRIVFAGKGNVTPGTRAGDVVFVVTVAEHAVFKRQGADLVVAREISLYEAVAGAAFTLRTIDGRAIAVRSREGFVIKPDAVLEVPDEGMPVLGMPSIKGVLFIKFSVVFPDAVDLSDGMRKVLSGVLKQAPPKPAAAADVEEVRFLAPADVHAMKQRESLGKETYDSDEEEAAGAQGGPQCAQQ